LPAPSVVSVNVGPARKVTWRGKTFRTAITKEPVTGSRRIEGVHVAGDKQADLRVHGGPSKAVYAYSMEDYAWWSQQVERDLKPGVLGENLTLEGIDPTAMLVGEQWRVGSAILEVSEPRVPCYKLGYAMDDPMFPKRFGEALRFGTYFRIVEEGDVEAGSPVTLHREAPEPTLSIRDVARIYMFARSERHKLAGIAALGENFRKFGAS
jgi:MOSC domain-containing protein YiiM